MNIVVRLFRPQTAIQVSARGLSGPSPRLRNLLAAVFSAGLLWTCFFPVAWGWLAWLALVPLLALVRAELPNSRRFLFAWLAGLVFYFPALQWIRVADPRMYATWAALAIYCSLYFPIAILLTRLLERQTRLPLVVTLPLVWVTLEYLRGHLMSGFAWYYLGHTQHAFLPLIQVADLAGAYGVSFAVAAVNAVLFEVLFLAPGFRRLVGLPDPGALTLPRKLAWQALAVTGLVIGMLSYGAYRLGQDDFPSGPRVALMQGNLDQRIRNAAHSKMGSDDAIRFMFNHYKTLCDQAMAQQPVPDLIVWPETSYPIEWMVIAPDFPPDRLADQPIDWRKENQISWNKVIYPVAQYWPTNVLLGIGSRVLEADEQVHRYNASLLVRPDRTVGGRYDKIHRVPFGEYVPLRESLPWMNQFAPYDNDYSLTPGRQLTRFALPAGGQTYHFGVVICYEDTDPYLARQFGREDGSEPLFDRLHRWFFDWGRPQFPVGTGQPAVDFLVNISNDGWFDGSCEHQEHLAICRFRAVECRRTVARAVNMGISAVIDGNGRLVALPGPSWEESKKVAAVLTADMPLDRRTSFYAAWGDWLPWTCALIIGMALIRGRWFVEAHSTRIGDAEDV